MTKIQIYNNAILLNSGKIAVDPACCCGTDLMTYECCPNDMPSSFIVTVTGITLNSGLVGGNFTFWTNYKNAVQGVPIVVDFAGTCPGDTLFANRPVFRSSYTLLFGSDPRPGRSGPVYYLGYFYGCRSTATTSQIVDSIEFSGGIYTTGINPEPLCPGTFNGEFAVTETILREEPRLTCPSTLSRTSEGFPFQPVLAYTILVEPA